MKWLIAFVLLFTITTTALPGSDNNYQEKKCLAETIYRESRGEPYYGKLAVGQVVLNRVKHQLYPNSICKVVFQKGQFPWTNGFDGFKATEPFMGLAELILSGKHEFAKFKATHFHSTSVNPKWKLEKITQIGNHIFYKL